MNEVPWTVAAFQQRRHATWIAVRLWCVLFIAGIVVFSMPFYSERAKVEVFHAQYSLSFDDMTGGELLSSLVSFIGIGAAIIGIVLNTRRYYRCPRCEAIPRGSSGIDLFPSVCRQCGAKLCD